MEQNTLASARRQSGTLRRPRRRCERRPARFSPLVVEVKRIAGPALAYNESMTPLPDATEAILKALVDANPARCLWFLRGDYYPTSDTGRQRVLEYIERYGDRDTAAQAACLRQWLSQHCENSASS